MNGWSNLSKMSLSATKSKVKVELTFGAFYLVSLYDELFLDGFHGVDLVICDVVDKIHLAVAASPNHF